jgi:hypothetical protein
MAKNDNLTDFLTDVADAIRTKKGTTALINPQNFSSEIASIESGGGGGADNGFLGVATLREEKVFGAYNFKTLIINDGVEEIATFALYRCMATEIILPNSVVTIGQNAFYNCLNLKSINLPDNITILPNQCFFGCEALETVILPENLKTINTACFRGCTLLKKVVFKSIITTITTNVFYGCSSLEELDFSACTKVPSVSNVNSFTGIPTTCKIVVPDNLYDSWIAATNWSTYASYIIKKSDYDDL